MSNLIESVKKEVAMSVHCEIHAGAYKLCNCPLGTSHLADGYTQTVLKPRWCDCRPSLGAVHYSTCRAVTGELEDLVLDTHDCPMCGRFLQAESDHWDCSHCEVTWDIAGGEGQPYGETEEAR